MRKIKQFFLPPVLADEMLSLRAKLLSFFINLHLIIAGAIIFAYTIVFAQEPIFAWAAFATCIPALGIRVLLCRGKVSLAAMLFIAFIAVTMPLVAVAGRSSVATVSITAFQFITVVMAGLLLGGRGAVGFLVLTVAVNGIALCAEQNLWYPTNVRLGPFEALIIQLITYAAVAALLNYLVLEGSRNHRKKSPLTRLSERR